MESEDIVISDLYGFFTSFSKITLDKKLKNINSIIPYIAFIILTNDKSFELLKSRITDWDNKKYSYEYNRCPWIKCKFVTRMIDIEKEKKLILILLYLCSKAVDDTEIYYLLSAGWRRIALFVDNNDVIDINQAPLRRRVEDKWVLCLLAYIKNRIIIQANQKKEWYKFSSELFFYFEYIIQLMDIENLHNKLLNRFSDDKEDKLFFYINEDMELKKGNILLLREKENFIQRSICESQTIPVPTVANQKTSDFVCAGKNSSIKGEKEGLEKQIEYYESLTKEFEKKTKSQDEEIVRLKNALDLLNEEISLLRTADDEKIILEDECDWEYLHQKRIVICGGRREWINRIRALFPQWKFIENDNIRFDGQMIKDSRIDAVVFNKRFVSHGLFYRVASQKMQETQLICISSSNVEFALQTICNKLKNIEL